MENLFTQKGKRLKNQLSGKQKQEVWEKWKVFQYEKKDKEEFLKHLKNNKDFTSETLTKNRKRKQGTCLFNRRIKKNQAPN